jgi:hypothetical protein
VGVAHEKAPTSAGDLILPCTEAADSLDFLGQGTKRTWANEKLQTNHMYSSVNSEHLTYLEVYCIVCMSSQALVIVWMLSPC